MSLLIRADVAVSLPMCCPLEGVEAAGLCIRALVWSLLQMHLLHVVEGGLHAGEKQATNFALNLSLVRITVHLDDVAADVIWL
jgi:hypothetical protein